MFNKCETILMYNGNTSIDNFTSSIVILHFTFFFFLLLIEILLLAVFQEHTNSRTSLLSQSNKWSNYGWWWWKVLFVDFNSPKPSIRSSNWNVIHFNCNLLSIDCLLFAESVFYFFPFHSFPLNAIYSVIGALNFKHFCGAFIRNHNDDWSLWHEYWSKLTGKWIQKKGK